MTNEELDAIRERVSAASEGPWSIDTRTRVVDEERQIYANDCHFVGTVAEYDAQFIAHSRTDIPALLSEVDRLREELHKVGMVMG